MAGEPGVRPGHPRVSGPGRPEGGAVGGRSAPWTPSRLGRRRSHPTALLAPSALSLRINIDKRSFHIVTQASSAAPGQCSGDPRVALLPWKYSPPARVPPGGEGTFRPRPPGAERGARALARRSARTHSPASASPQGPCHFFTAVVKH